MSISPGSRSESIKNLLRRVEAPCVLWIPDWLIAETELAAEVATSVAEVVPRRNGGL